MLRLYDNLDSGNGYKVRLLLTQLDEPFERVEMDIGSGDTRSDEYRAKNPNGRIPMLEWPDGRRLTESNAILFYLAAGSDYLPADHWERAQVLQWQSFEQYNHEPNIAVLRAWHHLNRLTENAAQIDAKMRAGHQALSVMEQHLAQHDFLVANRYTIADISLFAYTHVAHEGGFQLARYPGILDWLGRVADQEKHVAIADATGTAMAWSEVRLEE